MEINVKAMIDRIECRITELGITKEEFYASSGISSASFSQWNTGVHKPTPKKIASAAKALGVPVSYLVEGVEQKENPTEKPGEVNTDNISELLEKMPTPDLIELLGEITETLKRRGEK